jgi:hypothetical protein
MEAGGRSRHICDRALRPSNSANIPTTRDHDHVKSYLEKLIKSESTRDFQSSAVAQRILVKGNPHYRSALPRSLAVRRVGFP